MFFFLIRYRFLRRVTIIKRIRVSRSHDITSGHICERWTRQIKPRVAWGGPTSTASDLSRCLIGLLCLFRSISFTAVLRMTLCGWSHFISFRTAEKQSRKTIFFVIAMIVRNNELPFTSRKFKSKLIIVLSYKKYQKHMFNKYLTYSIRANTCFKMQAGHGDIKFESSLQRTVNRPLTGGDRGKSLVIRSRTNIVSRKADKVRPAAVAELCI